MSFHSPRNRRLGICAAALLTAGAAIGLAGPVPHTANEAAQGQVSVLQIASRTLGASRTLVVYLPPGYDAAANRTRHYPVLYLLSGAPGSATDWFRHMDAARTADRLIGADAIRPLILASPDGNGGAHRDTQFMDSYDGHERVETFLTHDVLDYVDSHYRTIRSAAGRGIAGYSAGAYGALNVGLHHPDLFGTLAGFCGYYTADPREVAWPKLNNPFGNDAAVLRYNSPSVTILSVPLNLRPHIFLVDTTNDHPYTTTRLAFNTQLTRLGVTHTTALFEPQTRIERLLWPHSWGFVAYAFGQMLPAIAGTLAGASS